MVRTAVRRARLLLLCAVACTQLACTSTGSINGNWLLLTSSVVGVSTAPFVKRQTQGSFLAATYDAFQGDTFESESGRFTLSREAERKLEGLFEATAKSTYRALNEFDDVLRVYWPQVRSASEVGIKFYDQQRTVATDGLVVYFGGLTARKMFETSVEDVDWEDDNESLRLRKEPVGNSRSKLWSELKTLRAKVAKQTGNALTDFAVNWSDFFLKDDDWNLPAMVLAQFFYIPLYPLWYGYDVRETSEQMKSLNDGLIQQIEFVATHEIAHIVLGHGRQTEGLQGEEYCQRQRLNELEADEFAIAVTTLAHNRGRREKVLLDHASDLLRSLGTFWALGPLDIDHEPHLGFRLYLGGTHRRLGLEQTCEHPPVGDRLLRAEAVSAEWMQMIRAASKDESSTLGASGPQLVGEPRQRRLSEVRAALRERARRRFAPDSGG
jgi:hypothetical protein